MTDIDEYQRESGRTAGDTSLAVLALGLCGEAGEVAELVKKHLGHGQPLPRVKLMLELGDVLWYLARVANENGLLLSEVAEANILKLRARYPDGFSHKAAAERKDEA